MKNAVSKTVKYILKTLVCCRLISPGSEWRLHREWYQHSAMGGRANRTWVMDRGIPTEETL